MLTWLSGSAERIRRISGILEPEDFVNPLCREVAELLWKQASEGELHPAAIIDHFTEEKDQTLAASMFHEEVPSENTDEQAKALFDVCCRIKRESLDLQSASVGQGDMKTMLTIMEERKKLEQMQRNGPPDVFFENKA